MFKKFNTNNAVTLVSCNSDLGYSSFHSASQSCSLYPPQDDISSNTILSSAENKNDNADEKPALPPKPSQGPPSYRDPPAPPVHEETLNHPDICINSSPPPRPEIKPHTAAIIHAVERPERIGSRTHAWVQEHKSSGKLVGEKLSSLQRKLKSLLTQSKETIDIERGCNDRDEKPSTESRDLSNFHPSNESSQRPKSTPSNYISPTSASSQERRLNYMSSSYSATNLSMPAPNSSIHTHPCKPYLPERHPFGAPINHSEHEDSADPDQLRDTCNKFFSREQRINWSSYLSPRNCYSNNIKSSYDFDKLVPKEVIGKPSQEKKPEVTSNCEPIYGGVAPFPSFSKPLDIPVKQTESHISQGFEESYFAQRVQSFNENSSAQDSQSNENKVPSKESEVHQPDSLSCGAADCGDLNDLYKSSSESGRGTMHSSMHGSKSVVSPHGSRVSAASNLDTSFDSDHSNNGTLWDQQNHDAEDKKYSEEYEVNQVRHIYETPNTGMKCRQTNEKADAHEDDASSDCLSVTSTLPPLSPRQSPPISVENSPKFNSRAKYKLSLSASALNGTYNKPNDQHQKFSENSSSKVTSSKKSGVRRNTSINQTNCRHRSGKSYQCTKASTSSHRLRISHGNFSSKKCTSSPTSRHHSRNQIVFPCYLDNGDPELTSTTTGLDMESLLDDADDYSSDFSETASTMETNEVNMIRKQLEGLETMYSEILRLLGIKNSCKDIGFHGSTFDVSCHSRKRVNDSLSSLNVQSSSSRGTHNFADKRGFSEKRHSKSDFRLNSASKRLQRLESHVVTLARSVAHLSSEMRTQHVLVQELENMKQDVSWVQERMRLMQLAQGCYSGNNGNRNHHLAMPRDWDNFHREVLELLNPCRAKKLTKFFGDEPPLIRQFLKRLGYEKYAVNFENEKIGIKELPYLTEERLQKMGIPMGPRIRILQEVHTCCQQNQYKVYIV